MSKRDSPMDVSGDGQTMRVKLRDAPIPVVTVGTQGPPGPPSLDVGAVVGTNGQIIEFSGSTPTASAHHGHAGIFIAASDSSSAEKKLADYVCDGTNDHVEINAALLLRSVYLMEGTFAIGGTITVPKRRRLLGENQGDTTGGARLRLANGANCDVIACDDSSGADWWHCGEIAYLSIDGNRDNNTTGNGIDAGVMGETSEIHHIFVYHCSGDGFRGMNGTPNNISYISSFENDGYGFNINGCGNVLNLLAISGDDNEAGFLRVSQPTVGGFGQVNVIGMKVERYNAPNGGTHDPCILMDDFIGCLNIIGGSVNGHGWNVGRTIEQTATNFITRTGTVFNSDIVISGLRITGYAVQINDTVGTHTLALGTDTQTICYSTVTHHRATANADTSGATLGQLETEVNQIKALLRTEGLMLP